MKTRSSTVAAGLIRRAATKIAVLGFAAIPMAGQAPPEPASPQACTAIVTDKERLICYDLAFGRETSAVGSETSETRAAEGAAVASNLVRGPADAARSLLDSRWELLPESKLGTFNVRAHRPIYVLPWVGSRDVNSSPRSPSSGSTVVILQDLEKTEVRFQLSLKTKAWQGVFGDTGDLWLGYTQSSRWQLYDSERSRPFRETNYEPEAQLVFATNYRLFGWTGRLLSVGFNHQSNGRDDPFSRSWNRVTAAVGLERAGWTLTLRPWWRIQEQADDDNNSDVEDYVGRADLMVIRHVRHHELTALLRHSLRGGDRSHGAVQIDWAFPIRGNLRGHAQLFHGYGESLIDYNFSTTSFGLGVSLIEWY